MRIKDKITGLFVVAFLISIATYFWMHKNLEDKNKKLATQSYLDISKKLVPLIADNDFPKIKEIVKDMELEKIDDTLEERIIYKREFSFGVIKIFESDRRYFLSVDYMDDRYIFYDKKLDFFEQEEFITKALFAVGFLVLLLIYLFILRFIAPINLLSKKLKRFSKGEFDTYMSESGDREIVDVAKSFNTMTRALKESIQERESLIKYIGHELKTPLSKAKFALQSGDEKLVRESLKDIENLTNMLLQMHLLSHNKLSKSCFKAQTLIVEAINMLLVDESKIDVEVEDFEIEADLFYMSLALKNLLENALKYSTKSPIKVVAKDSKISVFNYGDELKSDFLQYLQPFFRENTTKKGYGLGLSLVDKIVKKHDFRLTYSYKDGENNFSIVFTK